MHNCLKYHVFNTYLRDYYHYLIWKISLIFNLNCKIKCSTFKNFMKNQNTKFDFCYSQISSDFAKLILTNKFIKIFDEEIRNIHFHLQLKNFQKLG